MTRSVEIPNEAIEAVALRLLPTNEGDGWTYAIRYRADTVHDKVREALEAALPYLAPAGPDAHRAVSAPRPVRCPGCGHSCCPRPHLECGRDSDTATSAHCDDCDAAPAGDGGFEVHAIQPHGDVIYQVRRVSVDVVGEFPTYEQARDHAEVWEANSNG